MAAAAKINRGTSYNFTWTYKKNSVIQDLTGATVYFTVKREESDLDATDASAIIKADVTSHSDPLNGTTVIALTPTQTAYVAGTTSFIEPGEYIYDIKVKEVGGDIYKAAEGTVDIDGSPTNRGI